MTIVVKDCSTTKIAQAVREYDGVKRKHAIGEMVKALKIDANEEQLHFNMIKALIFQKKKKHQVY